MPSLDMNLVVGHHHILMVTLDTLRYDIAQSEFALGNLPCLAPFLGAEGWESRHSPATFTFAAHQAFFAGFLPTPSAPEKVRSARLFAAEFEGSETSAETTWRFPQSDMVSALRASGYHAICIGGVGFFNKRTALGCVLPNLFDESHWEVKFGVTDANSTAHQVDCLLERCRRVPEQQKLFAFLNVSAMHQPNCIFEGEAQEDSPATHAAALRYADHQLGRLFCELKAHGSWFVILCSDHGTAYGEDGYHGHRLAHPTVTQVPYRHFFLEAS